MSPVADEPLRPWPLLTSVDEDWAARRSVGCHRGLSGCQREDSLPLSVQRLLGMRVLGAERSRCLCWPHTR
jgi:hypothetical protein